MMGVNLKWEQNTIFTVSLYSKAYNGFVAGGRGRGEGGGGGAGVDRHLIQEKMETHAQKSDDSLHVAHYLELA